MTVSTATIQPKEAELREAFWDQVHSFPEGDKINRCLQCGSCTGTCPVSYAMDITPRETVALFRAGMLEEILHSKTIWICASCYSCTVRCPVGIRVTDTLYALKRLAMERKILPDRPSTPYLSKIFVNNIHKYGRNYELGLGLKYFLRTSWPRLFANASLGWSLIRRGRFGILPRKIKRVNEVKAIIERAGRMGES